MSAALDASVATVMPVPVQEGAAPVTAEAYAATPAATAMPKVTYATPEAYLPSVTYGAPLAYAAPLLDADLPTAYAVPAEGAALLTDDGFQGELLPQVLYAAPRARFNVPPELFAKLAAGGALTPEELAAVTGEAAATASESLPAPVPEVEPSAAAASAAELNSTRSSKIKFEGCC